MRSTGSPALNRIRLGMLDTSYLPAMFGDSSVLSLTTFKRPFMSLATLSTMGATILHGPHHGAQKSTRTGVGDCRTWAVKSASPTFVASLTGVAPSGRGGSQQVGGIYSGRWAGAPFASGYASTS